MLWALTLRVCIGLGGLHTQTSGYIDSLDLSRDMCAYQGLDRFLNHRKLLKKRTDDYPRHGKPRPYHVEDDLYMESTMSLSTNVDSRKRKHEHLTRTIRRPGLLLAPDVSETWFYPWAPTVPSEITRCVLDFICTRKA